MLSGTVGCAVEDETQKARYENIIRHKDEHTDESEGDMEKKNPAHLGEKLHQGFASAFLCYCYLMRFSRNLCLHTLPKSQPYKHRFVPVASFSIDGLLGLVSTHTCLRA